MDNPVAVLDACVLYPAPLHDLLMHLALAGLVRARWTERIHEEWIRSLLARRPDLTRSQLDRTRILMNRDVLDCLVTGHERLIGRLALPDPDDRHVLAAAIRGRASVIVTFDLAHFPPRCLGPYGVKARHPDEFIIELIDRSTPRVCAAPKRQRESLRNPPQTVEQYLDILAHQRLPRTVARLRESAHLF